MRHQNHGDENDCIDAAVEHMLKSLALGSQENVSNVGNSPSASEKSLHVAYIRLLQAARKGFRRQTAALRCANWIDDSFRTDSDEDMVDRNSPVLLSSSSTSSLPSDPAGIGGTNLDHAAQDPVQPKMQLTLSPRLEQQQQQCKPATAVNAERVPDYARKSIEELKKVAVSYG
ncbi:hypothetical protein IWW55_006946, partial [Coemansia sp. RSA 2706]